jgi:hypothetical protein
MDSPALLTSKETLTLLQSEAAAKRAAADLAAPDPCAWLGNDRVWIHKMVDRAVNPLPAYTREGQGRATQFDPAAVRQWFAEELDRRASPPADDVMVCGPDGVLLSASTFAREIGTHPQTLARRLRDYRVDPRRVIGGHPYYRLRDILDALNAAAKTQDPNSLSPQDRDAHWRAEAREDEVRKNRGELIPVNDALNLVHVLASALRDGCDLIPDALEAKCNLSPEALAVVENEIDNVRRTMAAGLRDTQARLLAKGDVSQETAVPPSSEFDLVM